MRSLSHTRVKEKPKERGIKREFQGQQAPEITQSLKTPVVPASTLLMPNLVPRGNHLKYVNH